MLNLLTSDQIRSCDKNTIETKPIASIDLMESASKSFVNCFSKDYPDKNKAITVYCGTGNNGGDGLAIARLLYSENYNVSVKIARFNAKVSKDFETNLLRLQAINIAVSDIQTDEQINETADILIDSLLGSGLNKPLTGVWLSLVKQINSLTKTVIAVDVPTGFPTEGIIDPEAAILKADLAITFQRAKINFFFPESAKALNRFVVVDIGLNEEFIQLQNSDFKLIQKSDIKTILKPRKQFSHKGTFGHALIIAGKSETMGAALLCSGSCLNSGAGLTTAYIPAEGLTALNTGFPEVMAMIRSPNSFDIPDMEKFTSIAAGPGLGTDTIATKLITNLILTAKKPLVLDADALNILSTTKQLFTSMPELTILTPHLKEFDRLFGEHSNWWERLKTAKENAARYNIIIVLKNRYTFIISPEKSIYINPTGHPKMSTGGMGDVLTGIITAFLAQGYTPLESALLACYIHGLSAENFNGYVCTASNLIRRISKTIAKVMA